MNNERITDEPWVAQPHCPSDGIVMRDVTGGWKCPECGHVQPHDEVVMPPEFDGPSIRGG